MSARSCTLLAATALLLLLSSPAHADPELEPVVEDQVVAVTAVAVEEADDDSSSSLAGRFRMLGSETDMDARISSAVEEAVQSMTFAFRPIARPQLQAAAIEYCREYEIELTDEAFQMVCDGEVIRRSRVARESVRDDKGRTYAVDVTVGDEFVQLNYSGTDGGQRYSYRFGADGLLVEREIHSRYMPQSVVYRTRYARVN